MCVWRGVGRGGACVDWSGLGKQRERESGTGRFRPRREQPGSNGARGSVLKAVAAHRRGMQRPRARGSGTRANIQHLSVYGPYMSPEPARSAPLHEQHLWPYRGNC